MKKPFDTSDASAAARRLVPKPVLAVLSFAAPAALALARPFGFGLSQSLLLGALVQTLLGWTTGFAHRDVASAWLLGCFLLIGEASPTQVLSFPLSANFALIASAFLVSAAVTKSGLADWLARRTFSRFARTPRGLVGFSFVAGAALALLVPQPFPRVIVLSSLYVSFLSGMKLPDRQRRAVLLSVFAASTSTSMLFVNGDVILNAAALGFAGQSLSFARWAVLMFVPALALALLSYLAIVTLFGVSGRPFPDWATGGATGRAETVGPAPGAASGSDARTVPKPVASADSDASAVGRLPAQGRQVALVSVALVAAWATEPLHRVPAAACAVAAVIALFALRRLGPRDLKEINLSLVLFLTAAFSIGKVLAVNGIAAALSSAVVRVLPDPASPGYFLAVAALVEALHLALGSVLTTMSVVIPALVAAGAGVMPPVLVSLLAYSIITMQYFLPVHHVTVLIGSGKGYYDQRDTMALGSAMAIIMPLFAAFVLVPWWRLVGAM